MDIVKESELIAMVAAQNMEISALNKKRQDLVEDVMALVDMLNENQLTEALIHPSGVIRDTAKFRYSWALFHDKDKDSVVREVVKDIVRDELG